MQLTLSRGTFRRIHQMAAKALPHKKNGQRPLDPALLFRTGPNGLQVRGHVKEGRFDDPNQRAFEYELRMRDLPEGEFCILLSELKKLGGPQGESAELTIERDSIKARWMNKGTTDFDQFANRVYADGTLNNVCKIHRTRNDGRLIEAMDRCQQITDQSASRYALGFVQVDGEKGRIAATDGRRMHAETGFDFLFDGEILIRVDKTFGLAAFKQAKETWIRKDERAGFKFTGTVKVMKRVLKPGNNFADELVDQETKTFVEREHWLAVQGQADKETWTVWFKSQEGRFPRIDDVIPAREKASTELRLAPADRKLLLAKIKEHPATDGEARGVDVLIGKGADKKEKQEGVIVRWRDAADGPAFQVVASDKTKWTGEPVACSVDRDYFSDLLKLEQSILFQGDEGALSTQENDRVHVMMPLGDLSKKKSEKKFTPAKDVSHTWRTGETIDTFPPLGDPAGRPAREKKLTATQKVKLLEKQNTELLERVEMLNWEISVLEANLSETELTLNQLQTNGKKNQKPRSSKARKAVS